MYEDALILIVRLLSCQSRASSSTLRAVLGLQRGEDGFHLRVDLLVGEGAAGVAEHQREGEAVVSFGHGRACVAVKEAQRFQPRAARLTDGLLRLDRVARVRG